MSCNHLFFTFKNVMERKGSRTNYGPIYEVSLTTADYFIFKMAEFHRLGIRKFPKVCKGQTSETRYWRKLSVRKAFFICQEWSNRKQCFIIGLFQFPIVVKEYGAVSHVDFCPSKPHDFVATSSSRVSNPPFSLAWYFRWSNRYQVILI